MSPLLRSSAVAFSVLALLPGRGGADEALSRPLTILSIPTQRPLPLDEGLSRSGTLLFLPASAARSSPEAISRVVTQMSLPASVARSSPEAISKAVTQMSLPARRPPANNAAVARSFTIETLGISVDVPNAEPGDGSPQPTFGRAAPNPFLTVTRIHFSLVDPTVVRVKIFDLAGRLVRTLCDGQEPAGDHVVQWDGAGADNRRVAAGVYLCRLEVGSLKLTRRIVVLE